MECFNCYFKFFIILGFHFKFLTAQTWLNAAKVVTFFYFCPNIRNMAFFNIFFNQLIYQRNSFNTSQHFPHLLIDFEKMGKKPYVNSNEYWTVIIVIFPTSSLNTVRIVIDFVVVEVCNFISVFSGMRAVTYAHNIRYKVSWSQNAIWLQGTNQWRHGKKQQQLFNTY